MSTIKAFMSEPAGHNPEYWDMTARVFAAEYVAQSLEAREDCMAEARRILGETEPESEGKPFDVVEADGTWHTQKAPLYSRPRAGRHFRATFNTSAAILAEALAGFVGEGE